MWRALILAGLGLAAASGPGVAGKRGAPLRASIDLGLTSPREADKIVAVLPDPAATRPPRKAVSDLLLVVSTQGSGEGVGIDAALAAPDANPPATRLFGVRLLAVVGGRLLHDGAGVCGGWHGDRSRCRLACDGGHFDLERRLTAEGPLFRLHVGGEDLEGGLLVSSCDGGDAEVRLVPKAGSTTEIVLKAD